MKKILAIVLTMCCCAALLAACGGNEAPASSSAAPQPSSAAPVASSAPVESDAGDTGDSSSAPAAEQLDLIPGVAVITAAAGITDSIPVDEIDLKAGGVNMDNVVAFEGLNSKTYSMDAGVVIALEAAEGKAADVAKSMESYRDFTMGNGDYEEFKDAQERTEQARIKTFGNVVVYAVSADGNWDALDAAIETAFA